MQCFTDSDVSAIYFEKLSIQIQTEIICLNLNNTDKIQLVGTSDKPEIANNMRQVILNTWKRGIQEETTKNENDIQFKLKGNPWSSTYDNGEQVEANRLVLEILLRLHSLGWIFVTAINRLKKEDDINGLFFRFAPQETRLVDTKLSFITMGYATEDTILLHNIPNELVALIRSLTTQYWPLGIQSEKQIKDQNTLLIKFKGNPFTCSSKTDSFSNTNFITNIFLTLKNNGWSLYSECMLSKGILHARSSFFFRFDPTLINVKCKPYICIGFNGSKHIRVLNGNENIYEKIRSSVDLGWTGGMEKEEKVNESYQFSLKFSPFKCVKGTVLTELSTNALILHILHHMHALNYKLVEIACIYPKFAGIGALLYSESN